jgi:hypothetical protein
MSAEVLSAYDSGPPCAITGRVEHVASVCMIIRVYSKQLVRGPTTRNAHAGSQSTIHPMFIGRRRARATIALMALAGRIVPVSYQAKRFDF